MRRYDPLDPRRQRFLILAIKIAWKHRYSLLALFLERYAEDERTRGVFDELPREAIQAREREYQEDLVATLADKLRNWLLENDSGGIDPDLPQGDEWIELFRTSLHEYFEDFAARLKEES